MKKIAKWAIIFGLIGVILVSIGFSMGAKTVYNGVDFFSQFDRNGFEFNISNEKKEIVENYKDIKIDVNKISIDFNYSEDDNFYIGKNIEKDYIDKINISIKDEILEIKDTEINTEKDSIGRITLYIPRNFKLGSIDILGKSTEIYGGKLEGNSINIEIFASNLEIDRLDFQDISIKDSTGSIKIDSIKGNSISTENTNGNIEIERLDSREFNLVNKAGNIEIEKVLTDNIDILNTMGNIDFSRVDVKVFNADNNGNISIDILNTEEKNIKGNTDIDF